MFFKNKKSEFTGKKSELTRVESFALSIAQWCISKLLPEELKNGNVFFTQVTVSTVPVEKLKNNFKQTEDKEYKAIQLKAYFTTLLEKRSYYEDGIEIMPKKSFVEAEILFQNVGSRGCGWRPVALNVDVKFYPDAPDLVSICYNIFDPLYYRNKYDWLGPFFKPKPNLKENFPPEQEEKEDEFEKFFSKLYYVVPQETAVSEEK